MSIARDDAVPAPRVGRPTSYDPAMCEQARKLCSLGATDIELADFFNVSDRTIYRWAAQFPEFCQALKLGKDEADERVSRSLYHRATGYSHEAVKIFNADGSPLVVPYREHVPPDTTAAIFWLKNRRPQEWRDRQEHLHEHAGRIEVQHTVVDDARAVAFLLARAQAVDAVPIEGSTPTAAVDSES